MNSMIRNFIFVSILLPVAVSCSKKEEAPVLDAETDNVVFESPGGTKAVGVSLNPGQKLTALWQGDSWGKVSVREGNSGVNIVVGENTGIGERTAKVVLASADLVKEIRVVQSGSAPFVEDLPGELGFMQFAEVRTVEFNSNVEEWTLSGKPQWVKKLEIKNKTLIIEVTENTGRQPREATVTVEGANIRKTLKITQDGILYYLFPCLDFSVDVPRMKAFEEARRSTDYLPPAEGRPFHSFKTVSPVFSTALYFFGQDNRLQASAVFAAWAALNEPEFNPWLKEAGFNHVYNDTIYNQAFFHNSKDRIQSLLYDSGRGFAVMEYTPAANPPQPPAQTSSHPTFSAFPYGYLEFGAGKDKVRAYETAQGGVWSDRFSNENLFVYEGNGHYRLYVFNEEKLVSKAYLYDTPLNMAYKDANGRYYPTREFSLLVKNEGFGYLGFKNGFMYANKDKLLGILIQVGTADFYPGKTIGVINFFPVQTVSPAATRQNVRPQWIKPDKGFSPRFKTENDIPVY